MDVLLQFVKRFFMTSMLKRFKVVPLENVVSRVGNGQHLKTHRPLQYADRQAETKKERKINH
jgi:hypothetical protein